jgi:hypothetical protein
MARIAVKVHPRAKRTAITGRIGDAWKLDLAAPPVDGKANEECIRFFAQLAGVARSRVRIVNGAKGRMKVVQIDGVALEDLVGLAGAPTSLAGPPAFLRMEGGPEAPPRQPGRTDLGRHH